MARTRRIKKSTDAYYHVMSRTNACAFLFQDAGLKDDIITILHKVAAFSGIILKAYTLMDNHFHAVCNVIKPEKPLSESAILERIAILKGSECASSLSDHWLELRNLGMSAAVEEQLESWRNRMHDVSKFTKTFKELVNIRYKQNHTHIGSIWSGRFSSTLIDDQNYLATCIRYVELNPVRAGLVTRAQDYRWSSCKERLARISVPFAGFVPADELLLRRIAQIGEGKVLGSIEFVKNVTSSLGHLFPGRAIPRPIVELKLYSTHGHRLAAIEKAKRSAA